MSKRKYLVIGIIVLIVLLGIGCVENTSPKSTPKSTIERKEMIADSADPVVTKTVEKLEKSTPIPNKILVQYNTQRVDKLTKSVSYDGQPEYQYPSTGMTYLVINLKITNKGYPLVKINKYLWILKVSTKDNPNTYTETDQIFISYGKEDGIECKGTELENGGWTICKVPFEVPENYDRYKIYGGLGLNNINIEWVLNQTQTLN